ncbi:pyridoxamine 5'-phosphate oxidase family protein [Levilactobacillus acidifarinae]|uniref:Flavin-nucleotide-binding protein n=1 Tax=Levilactobacillus acidifarinae DSM 19394 = JCM 15949 TaxID=1423715 RepID=A0A0R1LIT6_9LACO|nr:pyridoxamine 5'-phosphate oxidase family protein [Levilactobacillus acidifarinae]KRK95798.1 hypothetical protein FD25_GL002254 [Levilactobacillus acidifarinae DSM 19394]GEO70709.1 hypothetical protein LAC03_26190 [Levilactobacillus acidifarinae]
MRKELYLDHPTINWVLDHCKILRLGLKDDVGTYVVPVHYGYEETADGHYLLYVHGTSDGQKGQYLATDPVIGFETDGGHEHLTYTPPKEGAFGPAFRSVMGHGQVTTLTDVNAKAHALRVLLHRYVRDIPVAIHPEKLAKVAVWQIDVTTISARVHHPTADWQTALGIHEPVSRGIHYGGHGEPVNDDTVPADTDVEADATSGASVDDQE